MINDELPDGTGLVLHYKTDEVVNAGYYGRYYKTAENDAMGATGHRRTYSDRNIFFAKTYLYIFICIYFHIFCVFYICSEHKK